VAFAELRQRIVTGVIYVAVWVISIAWSSPSAQILLGLFALAASYEYLNIVSVSRRQKIIGMSVALIFYVSFTFYVLQPDLPQAWSYAIFLSSAFSVFLAIRLAMRLDPLSFELPWLSFVFYTVLPFTLLFSFGHWLGTYRSEYVLILLLFIWLNDSMAYAVGKLFGKNKLAPSISAGKTWEGSIGGWVAVGLCGLLLGMTTDLFTPFQFLALGVIVAGSSTVGDLVESQFKRKRDLKDTGTVLAGHGGFLDRLDSLLFCVPLVGLFLLIVKPL